MMDASLKCRRRSVAGTSALGPGLMQERSVLLIYRRASLAATRGRLFEV